MKLVERMFEYRLWQQIQVDDMQLDLWKVREPLCYWKTDTWEFFELKERSFIFGFVNLEEAFDRVPREVISWAVHKLRVEEWLVSTVVYMQKQLS